jgi:hypothetical protein
MVSKSIFGEALSVKKDIGATLQYLSLDVLVLIDGASLTSYKFMFT